MSGAFLTGASIYQARYLRARDRSVRTLSSQVIGLERELEITQLELKAARCAIAKIGANLVSTRLRCLSFEQANPARSGTVIDLSIPYATFASKINPRHADYSCFSETVKKYLIEQPDLGAEIIEPIDFNSKFSRRSQHI